MKTILVVDDDAAVRKALVKTLRRLGYATIEASDGSEAVHLYSEQFSQITAVTLDLEMPTTNGRETLKMFSDFAPNLPIVIATAYPAEHLVGRQPGTRGVGYLQKPFTSVELQKELRRVIQEMTARE